MYTARESSTSIIFKLINYKIYKNKQYINNLILILILIYSLIQITNSFSSIELEFISCNKRARLPTPISPKK